MERLIEFVFIFIFCYLIYLFGIILRKKRNTFNPNKLKVEETYLISKYNLDMNKIKYKKYLHLTALSNSLIFSITLQIVTIVDGILWQMLFSIAVLTPLIVIVYSLIGNYYKKKSCIKDTKIIDENKGKKKSQNKTTKKTSNKSLKTTKKVTKSNKAKKGRSGKNV